MTCKLGEIVQIPKSSPRVVSDDPQRVWPCIHHTVSFAGVLTSSFIPRVDILPKSENDTTDGSSRQTDWCVNEVIKVEMYSM